MLFLFKKSCIFAASFERNEMAYLEFMEQWHGMGCFNVYQIRAWEPGFDRSNLTRWVKREELDKNRLTAYTTQSGNKALQERKNAMMRGELDGRKQES